MKDFIKKLSLFDITICILFIVVNILAGILFKWWEFLIFPTLSLLIFIYFFPNKILSFIRKVKDKLIIKKKIDNSLDIEDDNDIIIKKDKDISNLEVSKENLKDEDDDIIIKKDKDISNEDNEKNNNKKNIKKEIIDEDDDIIIKKENIKKKKDTIEEKKDNNEVMKVNNKKKKKKNNNKNKKSNKKRRFSFWKFLLTSFLIICITGILSVAAFLGYIVMTTEDFDPNKLTYRDQSVLYDKNGNEYATLGTQKRESVNYDKLPQVLIDAIIATEDARFYEHNGVDFARFLKAVIGQLAGNHNAGGASTITMQISKNNLTNTNDTGIQGIIRKFRDIYISVFKIEKKYSKEEILEFYVNDNLLGGSNWGVEQASRYYFGKSVSELNLAEASTIAGMFQSPNNFRPDIHPDRAEKRRNTVLNLMVRHKYITEEEAEIAKAISVESLVIKHDDEEDFKAFIDTVIEEVENKTKLNPYEVSMKIYTTLDPSIQKGIDKIMSGSDSKIYEWENDTVQAGIAVVSVNNGEISAIGAGRNRNGERQWNYATQERRHPGSTAKPLFDYGPGFEFSNYSTYTLFNDEPWTYTDGPTVNNWDFQYEGLITLQRAIGVSRNIPALKAFQQNNKKNIYNFVTKMGIKPESPLHEAHAIGGFTGVTPLELAAAYATFANGGYYIEPHSVNKIVFRDTGKEQEFKYKKERVMQASTAYLVNNVLERAPFTGGTGHVKAHGNTIAAKTGTSSLDPYTIEKYNLPAYAVNDLWTAAYTPEYSFSVWYGYKKTDKDNYNTDGKPKDALMRAVTEVVPMTTKPFSKPDSVIQSKVEFGTWPAKLPSEDTPKELILNEYFIKGTQPTEESQFYKKFDDITDLKCNFVSPRTVELSWDYKLPETYNKEYIKKYFSQNVFGKQSKQYEEDYWNKFGEVGYSINVEKKDGTLKEIEFIKDLNNKTYRYTNKTLQDVKIVIIVKSSSQDGKRPSLGIKTPVIKGSIFDDGSNDNDLKVIISDTSIVSVGSYNEDLKIMYDNKDVTNDANIKYSISELNYTTLNKIEFIQKINSLPIGDYTLKYNIKYKDESSIKMKKLKLN